MPPGTKVGVCLLTVLLIGCAAVGFFVWKQHEGGPRDQQPGSQKDKIPNPNSGGFADLADRFERKRLLLLRTEKSEWHPGAASGVYFAFTPEWKDGDHFVCDGLAEVGKYDFGGAVHCSQFLSQTSARDRQLLLKGKTATLVWGRFLFVGEAALIDRLSAALAD